MDNIITFDTSVGKVSLFNNEAGILPVFLKGQYWEANALIALKQYIDPNKNILEIGGHCGTSSLVYASYLNDGMKVYVYEPQRKMYELLVHNINMNNMQSKIIPFNKGVFCYNGSTKMNDIDLGGTGDNVQKCYTTNNSPCNFGGIGLGGNGENIETITIDSMNHDNIGFIHCDAQGSENFIFSGGVKTIEKYRPCIYFENNEMYGGRCLYQNVCNNYPQYKKESIFNIKHHCMFNLGYRDYINQFKNGEDDLLIP